MPRCSRIRPAESAFLIEGFATAYKENTGSLQFGSACTIGISLTKIAVDANAKNYFRHGEGENVAFCDGHAKWVKDAQYNYNNSLKHNYAGGLYPQSPFMRVGD